MNLEKGDVVVVPGCGVGLVEAVEDMDIGEGPMRTYRIVLDGEVGSLWVPLGKVEEMGLRRPMDAANVPLTWELIDSQEAPEKRAHWNQRQRRYREMVMSNEPLELARLIGELLAVQAQQLRDKKAPLAFGERKLLDQAVRLVVDEIAAATGVERDTVAVTMEEHIAASAA